MPTLNWIGKEKVVNHHMDVPFRVLDHKYGFTEKGEQAEPTNSGNKIIHGDNLDALKALLSEYQGKVKCIYIDPPYNTGNEGWVYNDNVNDPKIKKWLHEVVGKEGEDLSRHDKWLCMMYPRLKLLHKLLADDGALFISIDDNEYTHLTLVCNEIFGYGNNIGPIIQNKMNAKNDTVNIQKNHEFILVYRKKAIVSNGTKINPTLINAEYKTKDIIEEDGKYYYINDSITTRGEGGILNARSNLGYTVYYNEKTKDKIAVCDYNIDLAKKSNDANEVYFVDEELISKGYCIIRPPKVRGKLGCWTWSLDKFNNEKKAIVITGKNGSYAVKKRTFVDKKDVYEENGKLILKAYTESNSKSIMEFSTTEGTNILNDIMNIPNIFDNPKSLKMIEYLIGLIPQKDFIILDSFAGSGTTAQAVLNLNKQDGGNRKFVLVEMEDYAETITAERIKRVINGYADTEGTGGNFDYYDLGEPLFNSDKEINESVDVQKINQYIFYTETQQTLQKVDSSNKYFLNICNNTAYYFYYEPNSITTLDYNFLATLDANYNAEQYIIYADNCLLAKEIMLKHNIIFKKIPRDITKF